ncbi:MAG: hypothetical protein M3321_02375 [Actinomycetota bacterium]|nr:hypothetical protein [Actinomycetota bacterium]
MPRPFFLTTAQFRAQHVALYDFVHATTAALWNTRWQVNGYMAAVPDATRDDLESRFVRGSGVRGVNVKRTFAEQSWDEHREKLAQITLVNTVALYEGWLAALAPSFPSGKWANELQFPSKGVHGRAGRGVRDALADMTKTPSSPMQTAFTPVLRAQPQYRGNELDDLLLIYRYFKELRNTLIHNGGVATRQLIDAHAEMTGVTPKSAGLKKMPEHAAPVVGQVTPVSLYGVIGFGAVVFHMVQTIDAELSQTKIAEREFLQRFKGKYRVRELTKAQPKRSERVRSLSKNVGLPEPKSVQEIDDLLVAERLIR